MLLVAFSAVTAATQLTVGDVRRSPAASAMLRAIMVEAWSIGRALGIPLADDLVDRQHKLVLEQADDEGTSLRHDLLIGHRMELDALRGRCAASGRETGIPRPGRTPCTRSSSRWRFGTSGGETRPSDRVPDAPISIASLLSLPAWHTGALRSSRAAARLAAESYGVPPTGGRFIEWERRHRAADRGRAYWIATVMPDGRPHRASLGTLFEGDLFLENRLAADREEPAPGGHRNVVVHLDGVNDALIVRGRGTHPARSGVPPSPRSDDEAEVRRGLRRLRAEPDRWDQGSAWRIAPESVLACGTCRPRPGGASTRLK